MMNKRPIITGVLAADGLLALFLILVASLSGWATARTQFAHYWYYIIALAIGFGIQVGLYVYLRGAVNQAGSGKVMAVTGTTSTAAMVSCCMHFLVNILPILGATGIAAFVGQYQAQLFWVGLLMNALGIAYIGNRVRQFRQRHAEMKNWQVAPDGVARPFLTNGIVIAAFIIVVGAAWLISSPDSRANGSTAVSESKSGISTQTSDENGMTVAVTPQSQGNGQWQFNVAINNHTQGVTQDMVDVSSLADQNGTTYRPTKWIGDPPGGHHRSGSLRFDSVPRNVTGFTLTLRELGGVAERIFRWDYLNS